MRSFPKWAWLAAVELKSWAAVIRDAGIKPE